MTSSGADSLNRPRISDDRASWNIVPNGRTDPGMSEMGQAVKYAAFSECLELPAQADIRCTSGRCQVQSFALAHRWSVDGADDACLEKLDPHLAREFLSQAALDELRAEAPANGLLD
jgi:hypothetical protein